MVNGHVNGYFTINHYISKIMVILPLTCYEGCVMNKIV